MTVHPFFGRIAVAPSPVDETQRPSGLVVPDKYDGDSGVERGVVVAIDGLRGENEDDGLRLVEGFRSMENLKPGTPVWYRNGVKIRDIVVVDRADILAYETDE